MKYAERQVRNKILLNLMETGAPQKQLGEWVDLTQQMIRKIVRKHAKGLPTTTQSLGAKRRLSDQQLEELPFFLKKGAEFYEFTGAYWTHERVRYVIQKEFQVEYEVKQVGRILKRIQWTWQKPQKKDAKQSFEKVEKWKNEQLNDLKKKAIEEDYDLYFHDESTLQLCANIVKTYSPRGETPILTLQDTKGYQHACIASSINAEGKLFFQIRENSFKGDGIIDYLKELLATTPKKILLIWDNAPWHKSQNIKDFLNTKLGQRLWVANIPPYSPEFNPDELVWANLKRVQIPNRTAKNFKELREMAHKGMSAIQGSVELIKSFFNKENFYFTPT